MAFPLRCLLALFITTALLAAPAATLTGRVYSDHGPPVGNAMVVVQPTMAGPAGLTMYQVVTDPQGKFTLSVPAGATYSVCVGAPAQSLLNSCEWALPRSLVRIPGEGGAVKITLTLQRGVRLRYRLSDPTGLVARPGSPSATGPANAGGTTSNATSTSTPANSPASPKASGSATAFVEFGLWDAQGRYHPIPKSLGDEKGINFEILVPLNADFKLSVRGSNIQITDHTGASVLNTPSSAVSSAPNSLSQTPVFAATAVAPVTTQPKVAP